MGASFFQYCAHTAGLLPRPLPEFGPGGCRMADLSRASGRHCFFVVFGALSSGLLILALSVEKMDTTRSRGLSTSKPPKNSPPCLLSILGLG